MSEIKVSVIIPVYNIERYIERCLRSVISQSLKNIEIIVVNDGSTDNSSAIINSFAGMDERIIVVNKSNGGLSSARNAGIAVSKGEYLLHIDGDDWIDTNYLQDMYERAVLDDLDVVVSDYWKDFDNGVKNKIVDLPIADAQIVDGTIWLDQFFNRKANQSMFNKLFRTNLYKANYIEHPIDVSIGEDLATTPRLMYYAQRISKLNRCYYHYIQRPSSLTNDLNKNKTDAALRSLLRSFTILREFFCVDAYILENLDKHRIAQVAIFVFTPQVDQSSELMCRLTDEYLSGNRKFTIRYSTKRMQLYSVLLQIVPCYQFLYIIQYVNKCAARIYGRVQQCMEA